MKRSVLFITTLIQGKDLILDKVFAQCEGIKDIGLNVDLFFVNQEYKLCRNGICIEDLYSRLGVQTLFFNKLLKSVRLADYSLVYIRNPFVANQISYFHFLHFAKKSKCKIILEIPTYPYEFELTSIKSKIVFCIESIANIFLRKYIAMIVYSGDKRLLIHGIKCTSLSNVGNLKGFSISKSKFENGILRLV